MRIQFCGADRTVTGSCHFVEAQGVRVLLDCGMYQGARQQADDFNRWVPVDPKMSTRSSFHTDTWIIAASCR